MRGHFFWVSGGGWRFILGGRGCVDIFYLWVGVSGDIFLVGRSEWTFLWVGGGGWIFFMGGWGWLGWLEVNFGWMGGGEWTIFMSGWMWGSVGGDIIWVDGGWVDIFYGWVGLGGHGWRFILGGWGWGGWVGVATRFSITHLKYCLFVSVKLTKMLIQINTNITITA